MERRKSPFTDFKGNPIYSGDTIERPDGSRGKVFEDHFFINDLKWRVRFYPEGDQYLGDQVDDQDGAAVVEKSEKKEL